MKELSLNKFRNLRHRWDFVQTFQSEPSAQGWVTKTGNHVGTFLCKSDGLDPKERQQRIELLTETRHPHLCKLGEIHKRKDQIVVVTNYVSGSPLSVKLKRDGALAEAQATKIFSQFLAALEYIHAKNLVHGRLCLENILYSAKDGVRLLGLLHLHEGTAWGAQPCSSVERYLPPEFFIFDQFDVRSEVYIAGIIMVELLTGKRWLESVPNERIVAYCAAKDYKIPRSVPPGTSEKLVSVINKCLNVDPDLRYQSIGELRFEFVAKDEYKLPERNQQGKSKGNTYLSLERDSRSPAISGSIGIFSPADISNELLAPWLRILVLMLALVGLGILGLTDFEWRMPTEKDIDSLVSYFNGFLANL